MHVTSDALSEFVKMQYKHKQFDWQRSVDSTGNRPTYAPASHTMTFTAQCSPAKTHYF